MIWLISFQVFLYSFLIYSDKCVQPTISLHSMLHALLEIPIRNSKHKLEIVKLGRDVIYFVFWSRWAIFNLICDLSVLDAAA